LGDELKASFKSTICCCLKKTRRELRNNELYKKALKKIDNELDIRHISKELRTLKFISNVMLTKYQRYMIPFFKQHLLNFMDAKPKEMDLGEQIQKTIDNALVSKLDKRVMKNIDYEFN